jgi:two-component system sensor kinase FixL
LNLFLRLSLEASVVMTKTKTSVKASEVDHAALASENRRLKSELTQLKAADQFVREREQVLQIILDSATDVIVTINEQSEIVHANAAAYQTFGYSAAELTGLPLTILMPEIAKERHHADISTFLRTGTQQRSWQGLRFNGLHRDGHEFPIEMSFGAMRRPDGTYRFTGIIRDITKLAEAEEIKRQQLGELAHRQRLLSVGEMASGLAHELNQPLLAICLQADAAAERLQRMLGANSRHTGPGVCETDEAATSKLQTSLSEIANQAERASRVIRSVRSLVRREEVPRARVSLAKIATDVLPICEHCCDQGGSQLVVDVSRSLPDVIAEETLIGQVIANLVQNAVTAMKDIPQSNRRVAISADEIGNNQIQVSVSDAGEGLSAEAIDHLFESFYTTRSDGLGLGLAICRSIIETHGGHIRAENVPDGGAVFSFTLPVSGTV